MTIVQKTTTPQKTVVFLTTWARKDKLNSCGSGLFIRFNTAFWGYVVRISSGKLAVLTETSRHLPQIFHKISRRTFFCVSASLRFGNWAYL
jgi:hypothetical protein